MPKAHNALGMALTGDGKMAEAVAHFREAVRLRPDYAEAHNSLGNAFFQQQNWKEAQSHYMHAHLSSSLAMLKPAIIWPMR